MAIKNVVTDTDHGWKELASVFDMGGFEAHIGFLRSSGLHKQKVREGESLKPNVSTSKTNTVAQIAFMNEFGSADGRIPERSFMRSAMDENKPELTKFIKKISGDVVDGKFGPKKGLGLISQKVVNFIKAKIKSGPFKENAPYTLAMKKSSKPLIDTAQMLNSLEWEIRNSKGKAV